MPLIQRSYLDLSVSQRREGARTARARIKATLATPGLVSSQATQLRQQLSKIERWEAGTLHKVDEVSDRSALTQRLERCVRRGVSDDKERVNN
jgi:hypothetical protein